MPSAEEHLNFLQDLISSAIKKGADAADAVFVEGTSLSAECRLGKTDLIERAEGADFGIRVFKGKRQAIVSSSDYSKKSADKLVERALSMAASVPEDPFCGIAEKEQLATEIKQLDMFDETKPSAEELKEKALMLEEAAMSIKGITNSGGADASWGFSKVAVAASNGFSRSYMRSNCSLSTAAIAGEGENMERDYDFASKVFLSDLPDIKELGKKAGNRAVRRLGAKKIDSMQSPVIFDPRVAKDLVGYLASAINGSSVSRKTTFLIDMLGKQVFSPSITITEDPHRPRGLRSKPCDGEGLQNKKRNIIDNGILTTWLLDLRSSRQLGMAPTGHAARSTTSSPSPSATNLHINPGKQTPKELISDIKKGLYITELFGQGTSIVTGDYSRGAVGFMIENGEITYPVNEITIASNMKDMFVNMTAADDLVFNYGFNSPTLRIENMTVAGN